MASYKDYRLDQLGIGSQDEADELERDLQIRFDLFTHRDRKVWNQQNAYLEAYADKRSVSHAADAAAVSVSVAQEWQRLDTLGFLRRLEIADLRFSDNLQVMALERAREPDSPASLIIALLRAHIPEKYSSNGHVCDDPTPDPAETLLDLRQGAYSERDEGQQTLRAIADGTYEPRSGSYPTPETQPHEQSRYPHDQSRYPHESVFLPRDIPEPTGFDRDFAPPHDARNSLPQDPAADDYPPLDEEELAHFDLSPNGEDPPIPDLSPDTFKVTRF